MTEEPNRRPKSTETDRRTRSMDPEKEPLTFPLDLSKVPVDMAEVMKQIKQLAESMLYHWKTFPIVLPQSVTDGKTQTEQVFRDLFKAPTFDELEQVALNSAGALKSLTDKQLQQVWKTGEFEVDSINFQGQVHRWRLSNLLQKGSTNAQNTFYDDLALSLRILIITARNRFASDFFSVSESIKSIGKGLVKLLDIVIGMPSTCLESIEQKILDEHMKYLVAELTIKQNSMKDFEAFCSYVKQKCEELQSEKTQTTALRPPPIPYSYQTPNKLDIDLRLFNKDLINNCLPILSSILDRGSRGWYVQYRLKMMQDLQGQGLSNKEMSKKINEAITEEYLDRVFEAIKSNTELDNLQEGIGTLLVDQAKTVLTMKKAVKNVQDKMTKHKTELKTHLKTKYPIKSRIQPWINEQIRAFEQDFIMQNLYSAHEEAINICEEQGLKQAVYFLKRDLTFIKERESILITELSRETTPNKVFTFLPRIWMPSNYIITKTTKGHSEVIPTVVKNQLMPENWRSQKSDDIHYSVEKNTQKLTTSHYPFWRWWNFLVRIVTWMKNSIFFFGIVIPLCSSLSWRALFGIQQFYPDTQLCQADGALYKRESSKTHTMVSRIRALWEHVRISRKKFEETPDRGFLGKSFARHFNRFWNYILKGGVGTFFVAVTMPVLCTVTSTLSMILSISAPLWIPVVTLIVHIGGFLIYDFDSPDDSNKIGILFEAIIWRLLIQGCIQPVTAVLVGSIGCPLSSLGITLFGLLRRTFRGFWDTIIYYIVIKPRARVPSNDSFVARRIAGPGLAADYFYQIEPEQALAAFESMLEREELETWKHHISRQIDLPKEHFNSFVVKCFKPFSAQIDTVGVYSKLYVETSNYHKDLAVQVQNREKKLNTGINPMTQRKIKLQERQLKLTILHAAKMLQDFYPKKIFTRKALFSEEDFWEDEQLKFRDWRGLACKKLKDLFSDGFLIPLEGTDTHFQLEVQHLHLGRYVEMVKTGDFHDDLDIVTEVHSTSGDVAVKRPSADLDIFNPSRVIHATAAFATRRPRSWPWKQDRKAATFDKLQIPLPIQHPASIAISIYNREHDQNPINYDDYYCQRIIRATKEKKKK
ncbi:uncharacterized protein LOC143044850 isoform X3 [Mytilus galloprovincialis]|uniref:uncharacterized protein LOC143044850 isoform X3 n=1 Tax=Mytilus galloprovincialis TaxID=29158 RepID=UPI003F7CA746